MGLVLYMQNFSPPSRAVLMTAEALGIKLQHKIVDLSKKDHLTEEFCQINPQHTIPTLDDNGKIIWDSHAINAYLIEKYGHGDSLYPKDLHERAVVDQRLHFDSGVVFPWVRYIARGIKHKGRTSLTEDQIEHVDEAYALLENLLNGHKWVAGDSLTIADFSLVTSITALHIIRPIQADKYKNITTWLQRIKKLRYFDECNREGLEDFKQSMAPLLTNKS